MSDIDALLFSDNILLTPSKLALAQIATNDACKQTKSISNTFDDTNLLVDTNSQDSTAELNLDDVIEVPTSLDEEFW
jgi:hypothetical protein